MVRSLTGKHPQYYEAILQLRDCKQEVVSFAEKEIAKFKVPLTKKLKVKGGWDYYLADNVFTKALGKKLQERFGGEVKVTASLWGRKDGKEVYRVTVLFREVGFKKGEMVEFEGEDYRVKLFLGNKVMLQKVKTGEKVQVRCKEMEKVRKKE